jgi:membrane-bound metal-dependent hydrolase YbcI (DUF457 family)
MPTRRTHILVGSPTGAVYAAHRAKSRPPLGRLVQTAGGAFGGAVGSVLPDIFEPAISSWHREGCHSIAAGASIISSSSMFAGFQEFCRRQAEFCRDRPISMVENAEGIFVTAPPDPFAKLLSVVGELFWEFVAGFLNGFAAGYVSHLALDAVTPRSIPLLTRGF